MTSSFDYNKWEERQAKIEEVYEALNQKNFDKAVSMAPDGYKLCGYQEFTEPFVYEQYGYGWAGQFEHTEVQPGLYPVFCCEYAYNEREHSFTNQIKDYPGICFWYKGIVVAADNADNVSELNTVFAHPYAHSVAKDILDGVSAVRLLSPFKAVEVPFEYDGEKLITYKIIDTSVPSLVKEDPRLTNHLPGTLSLDEQIKAHSSSHNTRSPKLSKRTTPLETPTR